MSFGLTLPPPQPNNTQTLSATHPEELPVEFIPVTDTTAPGPPPHPVNDSKLSPPPPHDSAPDVNVPVGGEDGPPPQTSGSGRETSPSPQKRKKRGKGSTGGEPAFRGYVESTLDALLVFEACRRGVCPKITRRLQESEKKGIGSGCVYVFEEAEAGIRRWTDGLVWSPSRILHNFLVYRELDKKTGDAAQKQQQASDYDPPQPTSHYDDVKPSAANIDRARERQLVGSLTSSYRFKRDGLVKKTISLAGMHLISYYKLDDVMVGRLRTPSSQPELASLEISPALLNNQNFRVPPQVEVGEDGVTRYRGEAEELPPGAGGNGEKGTPASTRAPTKRKTEASKDKDPSSPAQGHPSAPGSSAGRGYSSRGQHRYDPYGRPSQPSSGSTNVPHSPASFNYQQSGGTPARAGPNGSGYPNSSQFHGTPYSSTSAGYPQPGSGYVYPGQNTPSSSYTPSQRGPSYAEPPQGSNPAYPKHGSYGSWPQGYPSPYPPHATNGNTQESSQSSTHQHQQSSQTLPWQQPWYRKQS